MLTPLETQQVCCIDGCNNSAEWAYENHPLCIEDMAAMSSMNSDNEEAFAPALQNSRKEEISCQTRN